MKSSRPPKQPKAVPAPLASGIPVYCKFDELVPAAELKLYPGNYKKHPPKQLDRMLAVIQGSGKKPGNGYRRAAVVSNLSGFVTKGNGLVQMAQRSGLHVPIERQDYRNRAEEIRDLVADNKLAELAVDDDAALTKLLSELAADEVELAGVTSAEIEKLLAETETNEGEFPITAKLGENYDYALIFTTNATEFAFLQNLLGIQPEKSYKKTGVGLGRAIPLSPPSELIVIPSMSRAATMTTHLLLPGAVVCVPESQRSEYEARLAADMPKIAHLTSFRGWILTHPDSVKGLTPKLNWIFDWFDRQTGLADSLVFVDDDILSVQRCFVEKGEPATIREPHLIETIITNTARLARDVGAYYFGWEASNGALRYYTGLKPFMLTGYVNGCAMGFRRGHGLRFDPRIVAKNDFDIAAMNAWKHRLCVKDCRYTFCQKETFTGRGGQAAFRTSATEKRDVELLRKKWGDLFNLGGHSGTRKRDYAGVQKITMNLPF